MHEPIPVARASTGRIENYWQTPPAELVEWARPASSTEVQASRRRAAARRASRRALQRHRTTAPKS